MKKPTIKDVARHADVSIATVSRIVNGTSVGYSAKTKKKVEESIKELNYHPNALARGLISNHSKTIGVLLPAISGMVSAALLHGIEETVNKYGHSVIVCNTLSDGEKTNHYLDLLHTKQVEGVIFASELLTRQYETKIKEMGVPVITALSESESGNVPFIKIDDYTASFDATKYLLDNNHRDIVMLSGSIKDPIAGLPRNNGFKQALSQSEISHTEERIFSYPGFSYEEGKILFRASLKKFPEMTAIFAASDELAAGAIAAAWEKGINVPEDISVIGFDNTGIAEMIVPNLTTIEQPFVKIGQEAVNMLFQSISKKSLSQVNSRIFDHRVIERATVKKL